MNSAGKFIIFPLHHVGKTKSERLSTHRLTASAMSSLPSQAACSDFAVSGRIQFRVVICYQEVLALLGHEPIREEKLYIKCL